jgi:quercetin dioxygenase-like cupin family protein
MAIQISRGRLPGTTSEQRSGPFTGTVFFDSLLGATDGVMINSVLFEPGARTHWHRHERGQVLHVTSGQGRICSRGGEIRTIDVGDTVHIPPGEEHWHGASASTYVVHIAISLGETEWLDEVSDADYEGS